jgi:O-antigen ligase
MKPLAALPWVAALFLSSALFSHTVALRLLLLALGVALAAAALATQRASLRALPPIWLPFALWAAWAVLSLAWSIEPQRSLLELKNEILYAGLALWVCYVAAQANGALRVIGLVLAAAATALSVLTLYDFFSGGWYKYIEGVQGGAGFHSSALVILVPCTAVAIWCACRAPWALWTRVAGCILLAVLVGSAYATQNRIIWIAFAVQTMVLALLAFPPRVALASRATLATVALAVVLVLGTGLLLNRITSERVITGSADSLEADPRLTLWREAVEKIGERPLTGYGFGRGLLRGSLRSEMGRVELWHSHNLFLDSALQMGLPGVFLLCMLFGVTLRRGWALVRKRNVVAVGCGAALITVVLGTIIRNMTDVLWVRQGALLYWGVIGALLGASSQRDDAGD